MDEYLAADASPDAPLDAVFSALSDRTRRCMLRRLRAGECSVGELAAPFSMSLAAASKHIRVLEGAGLVRREIRGRTHRVRLDARPLHAGMEWIRHYEAFWNRSLDALAELLRAEDAAVMARADDDHATSGLPGTGRRKRKRASP